MVELLRIEQSVLEDGDFRYVVDESASRQYGYLKLRSVENPRFAEVHRQERLQRTCVPPAARVLGGAVHRPPNGLSILQTRDGVGSMPLAQSVWEAALQGKEARYLLFPAAWEMYFYDEVLEDLHSAHYVVLDCLDLGSPNPAKTAYIWGIIAYRACRQDCPTVVRFRHGWPRRNEQEDELVGMWQERLR